MQRDAVSFLVCNFGPLYSFLQLLHCFVQPAILDVCSCLPQFSHVFVGIGFQILRVPHTPHLTTTLPNIICQFFPQPIIVPYRLRMLTNRKVPWLQVPCTITLAIFFPLQVMSPSETRWLFDVPRENISHDTIGPCVALSQSAEVKVVVIMNVF